MKSTVESVMTRMMSTALRLGVAETACQVGVLCADSMNTCMQYVHAIRAAPIGLSASSSERVCLFQAFYRCHFLHDFYT